VKHRYILLPIIAITACFCLSGCSGGSHAHTAPPAEAANQPIAFLDNYTTGLEFARQERKPTLTFFSVPDNAGSQRMMETTFCDDEIKRLTEWLVCIHVDGSQESELCESLRISSFPTVILSNVNGAEVHRLVGRQTPDQLAVQIHILLQVIALRSQTSTGR
jgi:hypothetical protein